LLRSRRLQLHAHIAAVLEDRFPEIVAAQPALLAHHSTEAALTEKAVAYWLAAGRQAGARSAFAEAAALFQRGLALVSTLPDGDRRQETELDLQIALGQALSMGRSFSAPEVGAAFARARQLSATLNRPRALLTALRGQFLYHWAEADFGQARQLADEMGSLGEDSGDVAARVIGCNDSAMTWLQLGEFIAARSYAEKGLALYDPADRLDYAGLLPVDLLVLLTCVSMLPLACLGHIDQARSRADAALTEARRLSPHTLVDALGWAIWTGWCIGTDPNSLLQCADELLAISVERGFDLYRAGARGFRGWCLAALGCGNEGVPLLAAGLADWRESRLRAWWPTFLTLLGDACRMAGKLQAALEHLAEARRSAEETEVRWSEAETLRLTGEVLLATGDSPAAEASFREGITIAQRQSAKFWELRAAISLARLWRDQGKRTQAQELLAPVYGWFTEGCGTPVLQDAKALLDEVA
jgi:tetratricopeptide (TPR) repeat protein